MNEDDLLLNQPALSAEELQRRQDEAIAQSNVKISYGNIVKVESLPNTDYIVFTTDAGVKREVLRSDAFKRAKAVFDMLMVETGSADPAQMAKDIYWCREVFKVAMENGRSRGKNYNTENIRKFDKMLLRIEKTWRNKSDYNQKRHGLHPS